MSAGRLGEQPVRSVLSGRVSEVARALGVTPAVLHSNLVGKSAPRADVAIGVADLLGVPIEVCWTPAAIAADYSGPRRPSR